MTDPAPPRPPLVDSPWFWVYLFATFALIVLTVMGPRALERQSQLERRQQGRERAAGQEPPSAPLSTPQTTRITLAPLFLVLGGVWIFAWIMLWRRLRRVPRSRTSTPSEKAKPT